MLNQVVKEKRLTDPGWHPSCIRKAVPTRVDVTLGAVAYVLV